jgi:hypothetical protein
MMNLIPNLPHEGFRGNVGEMEVKPGRDRQPGPESSDRVNSSLRQMMAGDTLKG